MIWNKRDKLHNSAAMENSIIFAISFVLFSRSKMFDTLLDYKYIQFNLYIYTEIQYVQNTLNMSVTTRHAI